MSFKYQRENKVWYMNTKKNGKTIRFSLKTKNKAEAQRLLEKYLSNHNSTSIDKAQVSNININEVLEKFATNSETTMSKPTLKRYLSSLRIFVKFLCENNIKYCSDIKLENVEDYFTYRLRTVSSKTVNLDRLAINAMLKWAKLRNYINENPIIHTKPAFESPASHPVFFTQEELTKILNYHKRPDYWKNNCHQERHRKGYEWLYPFWLAFYSTGIRKGELENLEWTDIDLKGGKINISPKKDWIPKGKRSRVIQISPQFLKAYSIRKKANESDKFVFSSKDGKKLNENYLLKRLKLMLDDLGLKGNIHKFRHTFASHLAMKGVTLLVIKELLGHTDIETTQIYAHLTESHSAEMVSRLPIIETQ